MSSSQGVTLTGRGFLTLGVTLGVLAACGGSKASAGSSAPSDAPTRVSVDCPPRPPQVKADSQATLTVSLKADPPLAPGAEVNLRLYEETTQSTHKLSASEPQAFTLRAGVYVLRITSKGYKSFEGQANLTAGCEINMTIDLRSK